jgi:hypothetical protein
MSGSAWAAACLGVAVVFLLGPRRRLDRRRVLGAVVGLLCAGIVIGGLVMRAASGDGDSQAHALFVDEPARALGKAVLLLCSAALAVVAAASIAAAAWRRHATRR